MIHFFDVSKSLIMVGRLKALFYVSIIICNSCYVLFTLISSILLSFYLEPTICLFNSSRNHDLKSTKSIYNEIDQWPKSNPGTNPLKLTITSQHTDKSIFFFVQRKSDKPFPSLYPFSHFYIHFFSVFTKIYSASLEMSHHWLRLFIISHRPHGLSHQPTYNPPWNKKNVTIILSAHTHI